MGKLEQTTIQEIEDMHPLQITEADLGYIMHTKTYEQICQDLKQLQREEKARRRRMHLEPSENEGDMHDDRIPRKTLVKYLIQNEKDVDKRVLLVISLYHYQNLEKAINDKNSPLNEREIHRKRKIEQFARESKRISKELLQGEKQVIICRRTKKDTSYNVEVVSSDDLLEKIAHPGERKTERNNIKIINELPNRLLTAGLLIVKNIEGAEKDVFKIDNLLDNILDTISSKFQVRENMTEEGYDNFLKDGNYTTNKKLDKLSPETKDTLKGIEKYIDMDKFCLYVFMHIVSQIEGGKLEYTEGNLMGENDTEDAFLNFEQYLPELYKEIEGKQVEFTFGGDTYTVEEAKKLMERYVDGKYMSDFTVNNMISNLLQSGRQASIMNPNHLQYIRNYVTEQRGVISPSELQDMIVSGLIRGQDVLKMYENRKITSKDMEYAQECTDLRKHLTPAYMIEKIDVLYHLNDEEHAYEKETIKRDIDLYKVLYLQDKTDEEIEQAGKELIEALAKTKEDDERTLAQKQEGLLRYGFISEKTYAILASKGIVSQDDFISMYQKNVVHLETIKQLKEKGVQFDDFDIEPYIIESYMKIRENENSDKTELKKYIALYKVLTLKELSEEEIYEKANDLVMDIGTRIESDREAGKPIKEFGKEDRKNLYDVEAIPIDTVVLWADKGELVDLLKSETVVPRDMRKLYQQNSIILHDIQDIIQSQDVKLEQKIAIINIVFPSPEDADIREELFGKITELDETVVSGKESTHREEKQKHSGAKPQYHKHIFDTAVRYNSWIQSDEDVKMEILNDGHIAVHLPNVKDGLVVTEQFYQLKTARNGKKKMEDAWGVGAFVLPEEDYQANKDQFITKDHRVNRQLLGKIVKALAPKLEAKGISGNLHHRQNYPELVQKLIGMPVGLAKAKTEEDRQQAIKTLKDSKQYSAEEMERIENVSKAWLSVRESRRIYEK